MARVPGPGVPEVLAPYVTAVVPYDLDMGAPGVHRGMPGTGLTFELPLGEPIDVSWAGSDGSRRQAWSCVSGLHTRPAAIHHHGYQRGISVTLTLRGARALLGVPAGELAGELTSLPEVAPPLADLPEMLAESPARASRDHGPTSGGRWAASRAAARSTRSRPSRAGAAVTCRTSSAPSAGSRRGTCGGSPGSHARAVPSSSPPGRDVPAWPTSPRPPVTPTTPT